MKRTIFLKGTKVLTLGVLAGSFLVNPVFAQKEKSKLNRTQKGAIVGASGGAVIGGIIGKYRGATALGSILGATVGGAAGAVIGRHMDKRAEEIKRQLPDAQVERVGEGIKVSLGSDILFDTDSYRLNTSTEKQLADFAGTLKKDPDTNIRVEGHADSTGPADYNLTLSRKRAESVANFLENKGVKATRVTEKGYGEEQPVASNTTVSGRQQNRRVDIAIYANKKMQQDAKDGKLGE